MVQQGGVSIDGQKAADPNTEVTPRDGMVVQVGKRRFARLRVKKASPTGQLGWA